MKTILNKLSDLLFIDTKYLFMVFQENINLYEQLAPKLYLDYRKTKGSLKRHYLCNDSLSLAIGLFGWELYISFHYNFQERAKTPTEQRLSDEVDKMIANWKE